MNNFELFHNIRPIELKLPGNPNPICFKLLLFKTYNENTKYNKYHFIKLKHLNYTEFEYFTPKILDFYIHKNLKKYLKLFSINEGFFLELII